MTSRLRLSVPLFAVIALVAGCGGDQPAEQAGAKSDVNSLLSTTFNNMDKMKSATVDLKVQVEPRGAAGAQGAVGARLQGPFASQGENKLPKFAFTATLQSGGQTFDAGATWTGKKGFVGLQGTQYELSDIVLRQFVAGYEQALKTRKDTSGGLGSLGIDFTKWLRDARNEGSAQVGDAETTKISGKADVQRVIADLDKIAQKASALNVPGAAGSLPQKLTPQQKRAAADAIKALNITVYTGAKDRILRRLVVDADLKDAASKIDVALLLDLTFTKVGQDQAIAAPANPKSFNDLLKAVDAAGLGDLSAFGVGGPESSGSGSDSTAPGTGVTPNNVDKYAKCIEDAGGDATKARKCAALLSG